MVLVWITNKFRSSQTGCCDLMAVAVSAYFIGQIATSTISKYPHYRAASLACLLRILFVKHIGLLLDAVIGGSSVEQGRGEAVFQFFVIHLRIDRGRGQTLMPKGFL